MVLTDLCGLSNLMSATPVGVTVTFWKNSYLRSAVATNGFFWEGGGVGAEEEDDSTLTGVAAAVAVDWRRVVVIILVDR